MRGTRKRCTREEEKKEIKVKNKETRGRTNEGEGDEDAGNGGEEERSVEGKSQNKVSGGKWRWRHVTEGNTKLNSIKRLNNIKE